ncbi:iron complex transport system permease protein [Hasllibacter halocynthiae]|uniref:Iron complex transport system permease protein n=1 Tax=Hasllibacter halocynthiae TaxID=595589 RepID=A0A2T0X306_9RHOB|nr:iron ABC transporter permease [Hasllibacter halocynthiae]PRY93318.1 iron complex transport system permease protein [Hasllibacter halocynthiae]
MPRDALVPVLAGLCAFLALASLVVGPAGVPAGRSLAALVFDEGPLTTVMREIRAPRAVLGLMVGATLGLAGAALQGYLRNPLAEPALIGVSGGAALGAVISLQTGIAAALALALPAAALLGALLATGLLILLAGPRGGSLVLILAGIAVSALAAAGTALALNLSPNPYAAAEIVFWTMGSLADRSWTHVAVAAPFVLAGWALLARLARPLDALTLGEDAAATLGVDPARTRLTLVAGVSACVGAAVAVAGAIGFVGLVVPHLLRGLAGGRPGALLLPSALGGAALLTATDLATRLILPERDLKLGVLTALIGAPLFLHLIWRERGREA